MNRDLLNAEGYRTFVDRVAISAGVGIVLCASVFFIDLFTKAVDAIAAVLR